MKTRTLQLAILQHPCGREPADNARAADNAIRNAADSGAELLLLPELHTTRYFCQQEDSADFNLAEPIPGPTTERLASLARALGVVIVTTVFERRAAGLYHNTAVVLERDGTLAGKYRKMHIPDDPGYHEKYFFTPGEQGFRPIDTSLGRLGVLVCWDQWFPEAARLMALAGAEILLYPSAIGWNEEDDTGEKNRQLAAWQIVQRGHAIANALPLAASNRCGFEPDTATGGSRFWGHSFACGAQGEMLAQAGENAEIITARIDLGRTETIRREWPYLRDRRIDAYPGLLDRYGDERR